MQTFLILLAALALIGAALAGFTLRTARRVEAALPPVGRFVDVPGGRLHVLERGTGPALLLVHGLAGQMGHFNYGVVERLAGRFRVVVIDRPGSGYSVRAAGVSAALDTQADTLLAVMDALQLGRPVVVGHSLGGALALALAQRHPARVAGLALVAPLTHEPKDVPPAFKGLLIERPWLRTLVGWTLAIPATIAGRDPVLAMVFGPDPVPADYATRGGGLLNLRPSHFIAASADIAALPGSLPALAQRYSSMVLPVSVLFGREDRILNPGDNGQALVDRVPGAMLTLVAGGHMLPVTAPALTADFIADAADRALATSPLPHLTAIAP